MMGLGTETQLRFAVEESLAHFAHDNAVFMAERLAACNPSPESIHLLATAYHASGETHRAYAVLMHSTTTPKNRFLFALCAYKIGKFQDAENTLINGGMGGMGEVAEAYCYNLLGMICRAAGRCALAIEHFEKALSLQPTLWCAYQNMCQLGADVDPVNFFQEEAMMAANGAAWNAKVAAIGSVAGHGGSAQGSAAAFATPGQRQPQHQELHPVSGSMQSPGVMNASLSSIGGAAWDGDSATSWGAQAGGHEATPLGAGASGGFMYTPASVRSAQITVEGTPDTTATPLGMPPPIVRGVAAPRRGRAPTLVGSTDGKNLKTSSRSPDGENADPSLAQHWGLAISTANRRGARHSFQLTAAGNMNHETSDDDIPRAKKQQLLTTTRPRAHGMHGNPALSFSSSPSADRILHAGVGVTELCDLLRQFGQAFRHLSLYRSSEALQAFSQLPMCHQSTGWVQCMIGTAHFNMARYHESETAFRRARKIEPHRLAGMEVYSTVLWFLKREHDLCYLAQEVVATDRMAPQTWCVLGNCFSLQREFEVAIKFFQRAVQVDPSFTYAYTLAGHEHVSNEDFDKALASFRCALRTDDRHYNAWYGIGTIYLKQEKYQLSEYHFRRALSINSRNSVLHCYLGMSLLSERNCEEALQVLQQAISIDPVNPLAKLRMAMALQFMERYEESLQELQSLQQLAPRESTVYMQMGKVLKKLGRLHEALAAFNQALDLDPKGGNAIKAQIDKLQVPDMGEQDSLL